MAVKPVCETDGGLEEEFYDADEQLEWQGKS